jgi:hypothetical protein
MRIQSRLTVALLAAMLGSGIALAQQAQPTQKPQPAAAQKAAAGEKENVSAPGPTGGSCSATSTDGNKTCSISCKTGQSALCSNTKTTVSCRCG